jgi:hypothetical protein
MSVANLKTKIMITAEEFFRNKIKEKNPNIEVVTLGRELITAEEGMRWAHEFKQLHLHAVSGAVCNFCGSENLEDCGGGEFTCNDCGHFPITN